jgi:hypothetical protein
LHDAFSTRAEVTCGRHVRTARGHDTASQGRIMDMRTWGRRPAHANAHVQRRMRGKRGGGAGKRGGGGSGCLRTHRTFSDTPLQVCVASVTSTLLYTLNHSGWWSCCRKERSTRTHVHISLEACHAPTQKPPQGRILGARRRQRLTHAYAHLTKHRVHRHPPAAAPPPAPPSNHRHQHPVCYRSHLLCHKGHPSHERKRGIEVRKHVRALQGIPTHRLQTHTHTHHSDTRRSGGPSQAANACEHRNESISAGSRALGALDFAQQAGNAVSACITCKAGVSVLMYEEAAVEEGVTQSAPPTRPPLSMPVLLAGIVSVPRRPAGRLRTPGRGRRRWHAWEVKSYLLLTMVGVLASVVATVGDARATAAATGESSLVCACVASFGNAVWHW